MNEHYQRIRGGKRYTNGTKKLQFDGGGRWVLKESGETKALHFDVTGKTIQDTPPTKEMFDASWTELEKFDPDSIFTAQFKGS